MLKSILLLLAFSFATEKESIENIHNKEIKLLEQALSICEVSKDSPHCLSAKADYSIARIRRLCDLAYKYEENSDECIRTTDSFFETIDQCGPSNVDENINILKKARKELIRPDEGVVSISKMRVDKRLCRLYASKGKNYSENVDYYCCEAHAPECYISWQG